MGVLANIQKLLDTKLKALESEPYIAWPNTNFKPANYTSYIRPTLLLSRTDLYTLNDYQQIPGIYQVDVYGQLNKGVQTVYAIADEIKEWFERGYYIEGSTTVQIQSISFGQALREEAWYKIIVEISFLTYEEN